MILEAAVDRLAASEIRAFTMGDGSGWRHLVGERATVCAARPLARRAALQLVGIAGAWRQKSCLWGDYIHRFTVNRGLSFGANKFGDTNIFCILALGPAYLFGVLAWIALLIIGRKDRSNAPG